VIIALSYAFFYLKNDYTFESAIQSILLKGGDTDTNAAIVGGLIGARWGLKNIPLAWRKTGVQFNNKRKDYAELKDVTELLKMIDTLIANM